MKNCITLINFADEKYRNTQELCVKTGKLQGHFDRVISYSPDDIDEDFYEKNKRILDIKRGAGLWLWKPYFIYKTLKEINDGEYLFYCDSGAFFVRSIRPVIKTMNQDIWVAELPLIEHQWTKSSCFTKMGMEDEKYKSSNQIQASFLCVRKSAYSVSFIKKWLELCCDYDLISPEENSTWIDEKNPEFIAHREDQSILSLLCKKEGIKPHKDPTQFGRYPEGYKKAGYLFRVPQHEEDRYKTAFVLHRNKQLIKKAFIKYYLIAWGPRFLSDYIYWRHKK